jgi:hypothetical protein
MDQKRLLLAIAASVGILLLFQVLNPKPPVVPAAQQQAQLQAPAAGLPAGPAAAGVPGAPCATLPNMEEWRCVPPPQPSTVGGTSGLIAVIIIGVISGFILHIYLTRNDNPGTWPWKG